MPVLVIVGHGCVLSVPDSARRSGRQVLHFSPVRCLLSALLLALRPLCECTGRSWHAGASGGLSRGYGPAILEEGQTQLTINMDRFLSFSSLASSLGSPSAWQFVFAATVMAQEGDTSSTAAAAPSAYRTLLKYAREYTHSKNGESKHPIGLMMCGLNAGLMQSLIFNPYDRALYLTIKHSKDTSGYHRRFLDRRNWPQRPGQYFEGVGPAVLQKAVSFGLYFPMEELFLSSPLVEQAGGAWLAGTLAGLANGIFTTPFNAVKFSIWRTSQQQYSNPVTAINVLKDIQGREGLRGLFRGCVPTVYRDVTFCLTYATMRHVHSNDPQAGGFLGNMASAIVATALSSPFNWVRLQEYSHPEVSRRTSQWLRILLESEGLIGPGPSLGDGFLASSKELCRRLGY